MTIPPLRTYEYHNGPRSVLLWAVIQRVPVCALFVSRSAGYTGYSSTIYDRGRFKCFLVRCRQLSSDRSELIATDRRIPFQLRVKSYFGWCPPLISLVWYLHLLCVVLNDASVAASTPHNTETAYLRVPRPNHGQNNICLMPSSGPYRHTGSLPLCVGSGHSLACSHLSSASLARMLQYLFRVSVNHSCDDHRHASVCLGLRSHCLASVERPVPRQ